jgi:FkbM family methyltransferase
MSKRFSTRLRQVRKLWRILREPMYAPALRHGVPAAVEHDNIPYSADFLTVVDVGANRGQFALVAMRRFPRATLWCFEPLPNARAKLQAILASRPNTNVLDLALAAHAGRDELHITRRDYCSSLRSVGTRQLEEFRGAAEIQSMPVRTARLDEVITRDRVTSPALLKIDVQGSELDVLKGSEDILGAFDSIVVECSFVELYVGQALAGDVIAFLATHGYDLHGVHDVAYGIDGACLQADLLFCR